MSSSEETIVTLDLSGLRCPRPIFEIAKAIQKLEIGQVMRVTATDPAFCLDVKMWCEKTGNDLVSLDESESSLIAEIRRGSE